MKSTGLADAFSLMYAVGNGVVFTYSNSSHFFVLCQFCAWLPFILLEFHACFEQNGTGTFEDLRNAVHLF